MNCNFSVTFVKYSNQSSIKPSLIDCNCEQVPPVFTFKVAFCEGLLNYKRFLGRLPTHLITHNLPSQNSKPIFKRIRSDLRQIERELINHLSDKCRDRKATRCTRGLNMQRTGYRPMCADRMEQYFPLAILIRSQDL